MRTRRHAGFTLVELMVVVAIISVVGALAARLYSRGVRGETAPGLARTLMSTMLDARHMALTLGRPTRVTLAPAASTATPAMTVTTALYDTTSAWVDQSKVSVPTSMQLCTPLPGISYGTPVCPMTTANQICFSPNGHVNLVPSGGNCPTTSTSTFSGATVFVASRAGDKKYKLWIWGVTGMTKMVDAW
ncbi:MAG TPA: prepilin-type N-terminal cleavage/methylation domain-containing protein [Polyangia bacterium]